MSNKEFTDKEKVEAEKAAEVADNQKQENAQAEEASQPESDKKPEELSEVDSLKEQLAQVNDKYVRLAAEFDNYRRRTAKERLDLIGSAGKEIIEGILPILDDCERALKVLKESDAAQSAIEGTELIYSKLEGYLRSKGTAKIDAMGQTFDTDFHEAVAQMPAQNKKQKNTVIDIIQQGYTLNGKVIRYAKVVIAI